MKVHIHDPEGTLVGEVDVEALELARHVSGPFTPGPGFARVEPLYDAFFAAYANVDMERAAKLHEAIDALGLIASNSDGDRYEIINVYFEQGDMLFVPAKVCG